MFFVGVTEREVGQKGEKKGKVVKEEFSLKIVCQNHIPLFPVFYYNKFIVF